MNRDNPVIRAVCSVRRVMAVGVCVAALPVLLASEVLAQDASKSWRWTVGAGVGVAPDYEGSDDYDPVPIPKLRVEKGPVFGQLLGLHGTSNVINHPNWRLGPSFNFRQGYNDAENNRVDNLTDRGSSYELGLKGGYVFEFEQLFLPDSSLDLSLEFLHDVSSGHEGWVLTPSITFAAPLASSLYMALGVEAEYASGNYMSHYFSINSRDALDSGLDNYDADADFKHVAANFGLNWAFTDHWGLDFLAQYKLMVGDADDSPVIDDEGEEHQFFGGIVISYSWGGSR